MCIGKLMDYMDKWFVLDEIIPILLSIPSREPAVLMSVLGMFEYPTSPHVDIQTCAHLVYVK